MNIRITASNDPNSQYTFNAGAMWCDFPDIFSSLNQKHYPVDTTIELYFPQESHMIINQNGKCLFQNIHDFMNKHKLPLENFTYVTLNFKCAESYLLWKDYNNINSDNINFSIVTNHWHKICNDRIPVIHNQNRVYKYVNLNHVPATHRVDIINFLYENKLLDCGLNSFRQDRDGLHPGIRSKLPLIADHLRPNSHDANQIHLYENTYFSIVTETVFNPVDRGWLLKPAAKWECSDTRNQWESWWHEGCITEKTYKSFFYLHPFIIVGAAGSLKYLQSLGFKTFDGFIDESYDNINEHDDRMLAVQHEIHKLCSLSYADLRIWYNSFHEVYKHNQQLLLNWKSAIPS